MDAGASKHLACAKSDKISSTFYDIMWNKIRAHALTLEDPSAAKKSKKRIRPRKNITVDISVFKWYKHDQATGVPIKAL